MQNTPESLESFADVPVEIRAEVGRLTLPVRDILALREGSVLRTGKPAGEALDLYAGGIRMAATDIVAAAGRVSVRITGFVPAGMRRRPKI